MDRLPLEILGIIFDKVLWDQPETFYRLRAVSSTWNAVIERSRSKVFQYWYNRCKTEIPEDHVADIVQAKYPLVAQPWQEFYWVDSRLPDVPKNVYHIWKSFPPVVLTEVDVTKNNNNWTIHDIINHPQNCAVGMNDKYLAISPHDDDGELWTGTRIYRWDNLMQHVMEYEIKGIKIDFYTTDKGTFVIWAQKSGSRHEIYMSEHAIDNVQRSTIVISLGYADMHFITQNECFYVTDDDSTGMRTVEHRILTEDGFKTNTVVGEPFKRQGTWCRVEICGSTLYVMQIGAERIWDSTYHISRNSNGKLSFTADNSEGPLWYYKIFDHYENNVNIDNPSLIDSTCGIKQVESTIHDAFWTDFVPLAVHAIYALTDFDHDVELYEKEHFMKCVVENNDIAYWQRAPILSFFRSINWIRFIYIGSKAKLLVSYEHSLGLVDFY